MKKRVIALLFGLCLVSMSACGGKTAFHPSDEVPNHRNEKSSEPDTEQDIREDSEAGDSVEQSEQEEETSSEEELEEELVEGMRPVFKEAMDSYE